MRDTRFTFLCDGDERRLLETLSVRLARTQSDVIRWLIRESARELGIEAATSRPSEPSN